MRGPFTVNCRRIDRDTWPLGRRGPTPQKPVLFGPRPSVGRAPLETDPAPLGPLPFWGVVSFPSFFLLSLRRVSASSPVVHRRSSGCLSSDRVEITLSLSSQRSHGRPSMAAATALCNVHFEVISGGIEGDRGEVCLLGASESLGAWAWERYEENNASSSGILYLASFLLHNNVLLY